MPLEYPVNLGGLKTGSALLPEKLIRSSLRFCTYQEGDFRNGKNKKKNGPVGTFS
jgi:hypothetical protein